MKCIGGSPSKRRRTLPETRKKISEALRGRKFSAEHREKMSEALRGRKLSAEHREKMSEAHKGKKLSTEHRRKISEAHRGKKFSAEHRRKLSKAKQGHKISPENRQKIRAAWESKRKRGDIRRGHMATYWKGGRSNRGGYVIVLKPGHPGGDAQGYVYEQRLVMEKHLGRLLGLREVVHHINGNRVDNRIENLMLFPSFVEHLAYHREQRKKLT